MADRLRLVQDRSPQRPLVVADLSAGVPGATAGIYPQRGTLKVTPGKADAVAVGQGGRYGGTTIVDERLANASVAVTLTVQGSSADDALDRASALVALLAEPPNGRLLEWRPDGASHSVYFELRGSAQWDAGYGWSAFVGATTLQLPVVWACAPVALGDHADVVDLFDSDSLGAGDWAIDAGAGTVSVVAGELVPSTTAAKRLRHVATGYQWRNGLAQMRFRVAGTTTVDIAVGLCASSSADDGIYAHWTGTTIAIRKRVAGVFTTIASAAYSATANTDYWLTVRREGPKVSAEVRSPYRPTFSLDTEDGQAAEGALSVAELARFPAGYFAIYWTPASTSERVSDFYGMPCSYDVAGEPQEWDVEALPGDVPPKVDVSYVMDADVAYGLIAWWRQPRVSSLVPYGGDATGFAVTALAGFNAAATSVASSPPNSGKFDRGSIRVVTTATADSGARQQMFEPLRERRPYVLMGWLQGSAGSAKLRAGVASSNFSTPALALSSSWQLAAAVGIFGVDTADGVNSAVGILSGGTAITTIDADGLCLFAPPAITDMTTTATSGATSLPARELPAEWPDAPFVAVLVNSAGASELVRVKAGSAAGAVLVDRGLFGTTALSVTAGMILAPVPESLWQFSGNGAYPQKGYGFLESSSVVAASGFNFNVGSGKHGGNWASHVTVAGGSTPSLSWLFDPSTVADDLQGGVTLVEFYVRVSLDSTVAQSLRGILYATSAQTGIRYALEFGSLGTPLLATTTASVWKTFYLGTLAFTSERGDPFPFTLTLDMPYGSGTAGANVLVDYLLAVPAKTRMASPEGKRLDSSYPYFYNGGAGGSVKTIRSDRSGYVSPGGVGWKPYSDGAQDAGVGGARFEPRWHKRGGLFVFRAADQPPSTFGATTDDLDERPNRIHLAVQPRYALWRGAVE